MMAGLHSTRLKIATTKKEARETRGVFLGGLGGGTVVRVSSKREKQLGGKMKYVLRWLKRGEHIRVGAPKKSKKKGTPSWVSTGSSETVLMAWGAF